MSDQTLASKLLETLAAQDTEKRHAQDDNKAALPQISDPGVMAWLRGLVELTDKQIYNSAWND